MILSDGQAETESRSVDQWDNLNNTYYDEADQSALIKMFTTIINPCSFNISSNQILLVSSPTD